MTTKTSRKDVEIYSKKPYCFFKLYDLVALVGGLTFCMQQPAFAEAWQKSLDAGDHNFSEQSIAQAETCYRKAVQELNAVKHSTDDEVSCLDSLANTLALENKTDEAMQIYKKVLAVLEKSYGKDNAKILPTLFSLGSMYESAGEHDLAMHYYKRAIAINERKYGPICPNFANQLSRYFIDDANSHLPANSDVTGMTSSLNQRPGLRSSQELENLTSNYKEDVLRTEDNSNNELTSFFRDQISKDANKDKNISNDNVSISQTSMKSSYTSKRPRRI